MEEKMEQMKTNTILVCVDQQDQEGMQGRIREADAAVAESFYSLLDLLLKLEKRMDQGKGHPKAYMMPRRFADGGESCIGAPPTPELSRGEVATFAVRVLFRKNASWQGTVSWLEGKREEHFRSALELIFLMNSALEAGQKQDQED